MSTATLDILIRAIDEASGVIEGMRGKIEESAGGMSAALGAVQVGMGALGVAADAALVMGVKAASDFQSMLVTIQANTTMTADQVQDMGVKIRAMARDSGAPLTELGRGMEHITNLGFDGATALSILDAAMKSAVSTGSSVASVTNTLAQAMKEFNIPAERAGEAMNVLHLAAAQGNMRLEEFVDSGGKALSTAANLGVSLVDVSAAYAALTEHGFNAAMAGTQVTGMLTHIIAPSKAAQAELQLLTRTTGVDLVNDFTAAGLKAKGLTGVLNDIALATHGHTDEVLKLIPALRGGQGAMALTNTGLDDMNRIIGTLNDTMAGKTDPTLTAYEARHRTLGQEIKIVTANIHDMFISIGQNLLPVLTDVLGPIADIAIALGDWVAAHADLVTSIVSVVAAVGTAVGAFAFFRVAAGLLAPVLGPLAPMLAGIAAPIAILIGSMALLAVAWSHDWLQIREIVEGVWSAVSPVLSAMRDAVGHIISAFQKGGIGEVWKELPAILAPVGKAFRDLGSDILNGIGSIDWEGLARGIIAGMLAGLKAAGGLALALGGYLKDEVGKIDWEAVWTDTKGAATAAGSGALRLLKGAGNLAVELGGYLKTEVGMVNWADIGSAVGGAAGTAGGVILRLLESGRNLATDLTTYIKAQIAAVDWSGIWSGIQSTGGDATSGILQLLKGGRSLAADIQTWVSGEVAKVDWGSVWGSAKDIGKGLVDALNGIDLSGPLDRIKGLFKDAGTAIDEFTGKNAAIHSLMQTIGTDAQSLVGPALQIWHELGQAWRDLTADGAPLSGLLRQIGDSARQLSQDAGPLGDIFGAIARAAGSQLVGALQILAVVIGVTLLGAVELAIQTLRGIELFLTVAIPAAVAIANLAIQGFTSLIATITTIVDGVVKGVDALIHANWQAAWDAVVSIVTGAMDRFVRALINANGDVLVAMALIIQSVLSPFANAATMLFQAGVDLIMGLVNGIGSMAGEAASKAASIAGGIKDAVLGALGIRSPSTVFAAIGVNVVEGLIVGMQSQQSAANAAAVDGSNGMLAAVMADQEIASSSKKWHKKVGAEQANGVVEGHAQTIKQRTPEVVDAIHTMMDAIDFYGLGTKEGNKAAAGLIDGIKAGMEAIRGTRQLDKDQKMIESGDKTSPILTPEELAKAQSDMAMYRGLWTQAADAARAAWAVVAQDVINLQNAVGDAARAAAKEQLDIDTNRARDADTQAHAYAGYWKDAHSDIVASARASADEEKRVATETTNAWRASLAATQELYKDDKLQRHLLGQDEESDYKQVTRGMLDSDIAFRDGARQNALSALATTQQLDQQMAQAAAAMQAAIGTSGEAEARNNYERIKGQRDAWQAYTQDLSGRFDDATKIAKDDMKALEQQAKDSAAAMKEAEADRHTERMRAIDDEKKAMDRQISEEEHDILHETEAQKEWFRKKKQIMDDYAEALKRAEDDRHRREDNAIKQQEVDAINALTVALKAHTNYTNGIVANTNEATTAVNGLTTALGGQTVALNGSSTGTGLVGGVNAATTSVVAATGPLIAAANSVLTAGQAGTEGFRIWNAVAQQWETVGGQAAVATVQYNRFWAPFGPAAQATQAQATAAGEAHELFRTGGAWWSGAQHINTVTVPALDTIAPEVHHVLTHIDNAASEGDRVNEHVHSGAKALTDGGSATSAAATVVAKGGADLSTAAAAALATMQAALAALGPKPGGDGAADPSGSKAPSGDNGLSIGELIQQGKIKLNENWLGAFFAGNNAQIMAAQEAQWIKDHPGVRGGSDTTFFDSPAGAATSKLSTASTALQAIVQPFTNAVTALQQQVTAMQTPANFTFNVDGKPIVTATVRGLTSGQRTNVQLVG